ncbi:MAG: ferrous iron transport protein A [Lachnospirales bacterium]
MNLIKGKQKKEYTISSVEAEGEMKDFLFSLGCYEGECISIISKLGSNLVINIKNERYAIDEKLAKAIIVE